MQITESFLQQTLESFRREIFSSLHVAMPGIIRSYDPATATAEVQPALRRRTSAGDLVTAPVLSGVPVFLPSSEFVPAAGDHCLLIFCDFCIDGWFDTGQPVLPPSPRMHDLSDAFAIVGFRPRTLSGGASP